jgi:hypothetical protein
MNVGIVLLLIRMSWIAGLFDMRWSRSCRASTEAKSVAEQLPTLHCATRYANDYMSRLVRWLV